MNNNLIQKTLEIYGKVVSVFVDYDNKDIYISQNELLKLYDINKYVLLRLIKKCNSDSVESNQTGADYEKEIKITKDISIVQNEGERDVERKIKHYNLSFIKEIGYKLNYDLTNQFVSLVTRLFDNNDIWHNEAKYDVVRFVDDSFYLDVNVSPNEDTVWLTQDQIAVLFDKAKSTINEHIKNILKNELNEKLVMRKFGKTELSNVNTKPIYYYNLDMILAIGYRVNSKRGIQFRIWANSILKKYLLNGYVVNADRIISYQSNILQLEASVINIENRLKNLEMTIYSDNTQIIFEGEILEPYTFLRKLFFLAKDEITIIDQYADKFLLTMLSDLKVKITIVTSTSSYLNKETIPDNITIIHNDIIHDRFIFVDEHGYLIGTSFNDIGKKRFFMIKLENITKEMVLWKRNTN